MLYKFTGDYIAKKQLKESKKIFVAVTGEYGDSYWLLSASWLGT